jgi:N-acetylglucosamine repressor
MKKTNQEEIQRHNSQLILKTIYDRAAISRVEISRLTGLTRTTVSDAVARFIQDGVVMEVGILPSRGGKPPILLSIVDDARHLIGLDLADNEFRGAVVNLRGKIIQRACISVEGVDGGEALSLVYQLIEQLHNLTDRPLLGIGIGTPGLMDPQKGMVLNAVNLDWRDLPLGDLLRERFGLPIAIANDCQAAALAEFIFNNPENRDNLVLVKAGRGVGAGIVLGGRSMYGDSFGAGEIGHVKMVADGERCRCGNTGCLETLVSCRAIVGRASAAMEQAGRASRMQAFGDSPEAESEIIFQAYQDGDEMVVPVVDQAGSYLAKALAFLVSVLNINKVVIAGSLARFGDRFAQAIQNQVEREVLPALGRDTRVVTSKLGDDIVILGAAGLLLSQEMGVV